MMGSASHYDYLIIGGGIAGVSAAETIREYEPNATIGILSDEPHIIYSRVLLPSYLKKRISREQLFLRTADDFTRKNIDLRLAEEVRFVDVKRKEVGLPNRGTIGYGKLLLASGGRVKPWGEEADQEFIYRLHTLDDADRLFAALDSIRHPLIIGASFISLEFIESFALNGIGATLLMREGHFFGDILEAQGGELLREHFERNSIALVPNDTVSGVVVRGDSVVVATAGLRKITCDAVAVGIGIDRNIGFLQGSGIALGERGVRVNEFLEASERDIFAAGDIAEFYDVVFGKHRLVGNWTNAFLQGKRAAANMAGRRAPFRTVSSYSISNLGFQITALGDTSDARDTVVRMERRSNEYARLFLREGVLVGAALINRFQDKPHLAKLIESRTPLEQYRASLASFAFDIHTIPAIE